MLSQILEMIEHGLTFSDVEVISSLFTILLAYFLVLSFENHFSRIVTAAKRVGVVILSAAVGVGTLFISLTLLFDIFKLYSLPISFVLFQGATCIVYYFFAKRLVTFEFFKILQVFQEFLSFFGFFRVSAERRVSDW